MGSANKQPFTFEDFDFSQSVREVTKGCLVKPVLHNYLFDAKFPSFSLHFEKQEMERRPDGWFHPSTHPLWSVPALYRYIRFPDTFPVERKQYMSTLSVTIGKVMHEFIAICLTDAGVMPAELQVCKMCPPEVGCGEPGFSLPEIGDRGHLDGLLDLAHLGDHITADQQNAIFEFKCLAPETPVSMADGSLKPAGQVVQGDLVLGWDEASETCVPREVRDVWDNGIVPVWQITTKAGRSIGVTDEHPFLTAKGWVLAKNLCPGDKVRLGWGSQWHGGTDDPEDGEAYFLGVMTGDGCMSGMNLSLSCADNNILDEIATFVEGRGARLNHKSRFDYQITADRKGRGSNQVRALIQREGMEDINSRTKRVPPSVWTGGPKVWADFLSGYFDADGTVVTTGTYPHLHWASVNKDLLVECQTLLAYLGVRASIQQINSRYKGRPHTSWRLLVRDRRAVARATEVLSPRHHNKSEKFYEMWTEERDDGRWVRNHQQGWDEIKTTHEGLARPTIAIEVEGGTHVTAGLVTHNSTNDNFSKLTNMDDMNLEAFKKRWPDYWAQQQRYQRMTGRRLSIVIIMENGYPWTMREFHIPYDHAFNAEIDQKYRDVLQAVESTREVFCCNSKGCKAARLCGVGI